MIPMCRYNKREPVELTLTEATKLALKCAANMDHIEMKDGDESTCFIITSYHYDNTMIKIYYYDHPGITITGVVVEGEDRAPQQFETDGCMPLVHELIQATKRAYYQGIQSVA